MAHPGIKPSLTLGERAADMVVSAMGSWRFIIVQATLMAVWTLANIAGAFHWDPYPFILLNLALSTQAAFAASLLLIAGRRSDQRSREVAEHDFLTDRQTRTIIERIALELHVPVGELPGMTADHDCNSPSTATAPTGAG